MNIKLSVADRLYLLNLDTLKIGKITTMQLIKSLFDKIGFTEQELVEWEIREEGTGVFWNPTKAKDIEVSLSKPVIEIIIDAFDRSTQVPIDSLNLYNRLRECLNKDES